MSLISNNNSNNSNNNNFNINANRNSKRKLQMLKRKAYLKDKDDFKKLYNNDEEDFNEKINNNISNSNINNNNINNINEEYDENTNNKTVSTNTNNFNKSSLTSTKEDVNVNISELDCSFDSNNNINNNNNNNTLNNNNNKSITYISLNSFIPLNNHLKTKLNGTFSYIQAITDLIEKDKFKNNDNIDIIKEEDEEKENKKHKKSSSIDLKKRKIHLKFNHLFLNKKISFKKLNIFHSTKDIKKINNINSNLNIIYNNTIHKLKRFTIFNLFL